MLLGMVVREMTVTSVKKLCKCGRFELNVRKGKFLLFYLRKFLIYVNGLWCAIKSY